MIHPGVKPDMLVNSGALQMAINVLERAGKHEVVEELKLTMTRIDQECQKMRFVKIDISNNVPLYLIEELITEKLQWETGSFNVVRMEYSDNEKQTFVDFPTDLTGDTADLMLNEISLYFVTLSSHYDNYKPTIQELLHRL